MSSYCEPLLEVVDEIPPDLLAFYSRVESGDYSGRNDVEVNFLTPATAATLTLEFRDFHPLVDLSRCILLDDADTSDHLCYLPGPPQAGAVFHLTHDGRPAKIVFRDLQSLIEAAERAIESGVSLDTFFDRQSFIADAQDELLPLIREAASLADEYDTAPLLDLLVRYADYDLDSELFFGACEYVPEAIAQTIHERPHLSYLPLAQKLAASNLRQIARTAEEAVAKIDAMSE
ncbi:hypothetical protein Mal4_46760 [Maioricimonas rarisocia]|uniref:Uncharacterized protein n=1 Tax=Maioricimonas rarisocia TaxID=2528026 RepID=A0A517ZD04_9PLAN|nr:hypothetical protein [Maioricimonas rarisocia]QDU40320.1 hypothetical protein Mal4_46760 [Maioricimonas rarisocia]